MATNGVPAVGRPQMPAPIVVDEDFYRVNVLRLPMGVTEEAVDVQLAQQAELLDIMPNHSETDIDCLGSSLSGTTISSDTNKQESILSSSTAPTSCSSSVDRPLTQSSHTPQLEALSDFPPMSWDPEKKRHSGFRSNFRKMAGLSRKRRSLAATSMDSIQIDVTSSSIRNSPTSDLKSPTSIKSGQSSWSNPISAPKSSYEHSTVVDHDAMKRSMECADMLNLRASQLEERMRFLQLQNQFISEIRQQRDLLRAEWRQVHERVVEKQAQKNEKAIEELEARHLDDELKMQTDHDTEKRTVLIRLKYMEAYCQNPTPPPTPIDAISGRPSTDSTFPERTVTQKDWNNLAQQYRERDVMDSLHAAKINVLRGKQKKAVENLTRRKERELGLLRAEQQKELDRIDQDFGHQESNVRIAFGTKRARLEKRWRLQALIEQTKVERRTGLKHAPLPDVVASEDFKSSTSMTTGIKAVASLPILNVA